MQAVGKMRVVVRVMLTSVNSVSLVGNDVISWHCIVGRGVMKRMERDKENGIYNIAFLLAKLINTALIRKVLLIYFFN